MPPRGQIGDIVEISRTEDRLSFEWLIQDFLNLSSEGVDFHNSPDFVLGGERWFLSVWPGGMTWASFDWVDLYLFRKASGPGVTLGVSLAVEGRQKRETTHRFSSKDDGCGWSNFCPRSILLDDPRLLPEGVLTITCEVQRISNLEAPNTHETASNEEAPIETEVISEISQTTENEAAPPLHRHGSVISCMKVLLQEERRFDFILKLGGREWRLHKFILESRSPFFAEKFLEEWAESGEGVVSSDVREEALDNVLRFIYTGEVEDVYVEDLCDLYVAAHSCKMEDLKPLCIESMEENMCPEIVCEALALAKEYKEEGLNRAALECFVREARQIFDTEAYRNLKEKHPDILAEILEERGRLI